MFETNFSYQSSTPIPPNISITIALNLLHDFETINRLNPDVRGQRPIQPKDGTSKMVDCTGNPAIGQTQYFEVEDDLPFIPKRLWSGGVKYQADFVPLPAGCDITIHAPGGFTSVNHWRLVHEEDRTADSAREDGAQTPNELGRVKSKDLLHAGGVWYVQLVSDARCSRTFAGFVKGFLKNSHAQLERAFVEKAREESGRNGLRDGRQQQQQRPAGIRRPTGGRRRSSRF